MLRQPQITDAATGRRDGSDAPVGGQTSPRCGCPTAPASTACGPSPLAVLLYHADLTWIPGGFLGVEVFFVISGYLISALLLAEWRQKGRINLKEFWLRRARRLLPALYVLLVVTLSYAVVFLPGEVAGLRGDVLAAIGYVTNWFLIFGQESYFEAVGRPSVLQHLWSLAVEEQFYLIWPVVLAVGLGVGMKYRRQRWVLTVAVVGGGGVGGGHGAALHAQRRSVQDLLRHRHAGYGLAVRSCPCLPVVTRGTSTVRAQPPISASSSPVGDGSGVAGGGRPRSCSTSSPSAP